MFVKQPDETLKVGSRQMRSLRQRFHKITPKKKKKRKKSLLKSELQGNISAQFHCHFFLNLLS